MQDTKLPNFRSAHGPFGVGGPSVCSWSEVVFTSNYKYGPNPITQHERLLI
jgi:hypothetical protein